MSKIIVALDGMSLGEAQGLALHLKNLGVLFKVNDQLDGNVGPSCISTLKEYGGVMSDPKYHDIPATVEKRVKKMAGYQPDFITIHASGGIQMMQAAVENRSTSRILAVTVLTSFSSHECELSLGASTNAKVLQYARGAVIAGVQGIVCSPNELQFLSQYPELNSLIRVTPGIRPVGTDTHDQKRVGTPHNAVMAGADYLVIGRAITKAKDPYETTKKILEEIEEAMEEKLRREDE